MYGGDDVGSVNDYCGDVYVDSKYAGWTGYGGDYERDVDVYDVYDCDGGCGCGLM